MNMMIERKECEMVLVPLNEYILLKDAANKWYLYSNQRDKMCFESLPDHTGQRKHYTCKNLIEEIKTSWRNVNILS